MKKKFLLFFILSIGSALISIFFFDRHVVLWFDSAYFKEHYWQFFRTWTDAGLGENFFIISIGGYLLSLIWKERFQLLRTWSLQFLACLVSSGLVLQLFKHLIGRKRPLETVNFDPFVFEPLNANHFFHSMPSGHTQVIFCAATLFSVAMPRWKWLWFSFAAFIAFTRVATQQHWLSDTFVGAYIGWGVPVLTLQWIKNRKEKEIKK